MAKTQTVQKVKLLCAENVCFSIGDTKIAAKDLTVEQAQQVAAQYPGMYVKIINQTINVAESEATQE